jgi:hypothetical protein
MSHALNIEGMFAENKRAQNEDAKVLNGRLLALEKNHLDLRKTLGP